MVMHLGQRAHFRLGLLSLVSGDIDVEVLR
jgi:hypothetical protein